MAEVLKLAVGETVELTGPVTVDLVDVDEDYVVATASQPMAGASLFLTGVEGIKCVVRDGR